LHKASSNEDIEIFFCQEGVVMKSIPILLAFFVLCFAVGAVADEEPLASQDEPLVFLNTNSEIYGIGFNDLDLHSMLGKRLRAEGYRINHGKLGDLTDEILEGMDVLILLDPNFALLDEDKQALRNFLRDGGGLVLMVCQGYADLSNLGSFLVDYGIRFNPKTSQDTLAGVLSGSPLSGPRLCRQIGYNETGRVYQLLDQGNAQAAAVTGSGYIVSSTSTHKNLGRGGIVVIGYDCLFMNMFIDDHDNSAFALNVMDYLTSGFDLSVGLCKFKGRNVTAGDRVRVIGRVRNVSSKRSEATSVRFVLSSTNAYDGSPPEVVATLGNVNLPALGPGGFKKVKKKFRVPSGVAPGDYYVIAVADPDGTSGDANADNNYKASRKRITIR